MTSSAESEKAGQVRDGSAADHAQERLRGGGWAGMRSRAGRCVACRFGPGSVNSRHQSAFSPLGVLFAVWACFLSSRGRFLRSGRAFSRHVGAFSGLGVLFAVTGELFAVWARFLPSRGSFLRSGRAFCRHGGAFSGLEELFALTPRWQGGGVAVNRQARSDHGRSARSHFSLKWAAGSGNNNPAERTKSDGQDQGPGWKLVVIRRGWDFPASCS